MLSLFQLFKIIFGVIISGFILFVIINFLGAYTSFQGDSVKGVIIKNFVKTTGDVYLSGNSIVFEGFRDKDLILAIDENEPEGIISIVGTLPLFYPLFPSFAEEDVFVSRQELDMGWWNFQYMTALPETLILFSAVSPEWDLVRGVTSSLPDSDFFTPKVTFGICDGPRIDDRLCGGPCERDDFMSVTIGRTMPTSACTAALPEGARLLTISPSCTGVPGVCVSTPNRDGIGTIGLGSRLIGLYKDPVDIAATVIGGDEEDIYGKTGETLYIYKNNFFRREVGLAARVLAIRAVPLIGPRHPALPVSECQLAFNNFRQTMNALDIFLDGNEDYYKNQADTQNLVTMLTKARNDHQELLSKGCDYR